MRFQLVGCDYGRDQLTALRRRSRRPISAVCQVCGLQVAPPVMAATNRRKGYSPLALCGTVVHHKSSRLTYLMKASATLGAAPVRVTQKLSGLEHEPSAQKKPLVLAGSVVRFASKQLSICTNTKMTASAHCFLGRLNQASREDSKRREKMFTLADVTTRRGAQQTDNGGPSPPNSFWLELLDTHEQGNG